MKKILHLEWLKLKSQYIMEYFHIVTCGGLFSSTVLIIPDLRFHAFSIPTYLWLQHSCEGPAGNASSLTIGGQEHCTFGLCLVAGLHLKMFANHLKTLLTYDSGIIRCRFAYLTNSISHNGTFQYHFLGVPWLRLIALSVPWQLSRCPRVPWSPRWAPVGWWSPGDAVTKSLRRAVGREYWWQKCRPVGALKTSRERTCHAFDGQVTL